MREAVRTAKALGDAARLRAVLALRRGELCACQLVALLDLAPSTVSRHMSVLRAAGLVTSRKRGRWVRYRLAGRGASPAVRGALAWAASAASRSARAERDAAKLREILARPPEEICRLVARRGWRTGRDA